MKKISNKSLLFIAIILVGVALCIFMLSFSINALLITAGGLAVLLLFVYLLFRLSDTDCVADYKLIRFTKKLKKLLGEASTVYIMGHKFSDLDSLGASYGLYYALRNKYNVKLVANKQTTLARPLVDFLRFSDKDCNIYDYSEIADTVDEKSLVIVVDTHRQMIMDFPELYDKAGNIVIIDHHRKSDDFRDRTAACYMKSSASSACEIVTVMCELLKIRKLGIVPATALLSGIMLDTKNFVMNTNANTFRAASFLRKNRADPVLIKKMFSESVDVCKRKYDIVSDVKLYESFAIAKTDTNDQYTRIATAQAADELLGINGVVAAFVMCPSDDKINISARSFGDVDVQKIMAKLGGGGHKTVSACQIKCGGFEKAESLLKKAIKEYIDER
ncbi:MAG: DHH family phosphoesterase [Clostridia bacterium]|nr:DHH family phosphoesterase [Clostridia bacterium]